MTATQPVPTRTTWARLVNPTAFRTSLRWLFIGVLTVIAFHATIINLILATRADAIGSYVWTVPLAGIVAAVAVARRERTELPIHDRQADVIIGTMGLVLALLLHAVLLQRYALYFYLLRLDLVAMWMFVISSSVVLFGLRPVFRFVRVWALLLMVFPLPFYITVILLGGTRTAAALATLLIAGTATGIAVGRTRKRGYVGGFAAWGVGLTVLLAMKVFFPHAAILAYVLIPAMVAIVAVSLAAVLLFAPRRSEAPAGAQGCAVGRPAGVGGHPTGARRRHRLGVRASSRDGHPAAHAIPRHAVWHCARVARRLAQHRPADLFLGQAAVRPRRAPPPPDNGRRYQKSPVGQVIPGANSRGGHPHHLPAGLPGRLSCQGALRRRAEPR